MVRNFLKTFLPKAGYSEADKGEKSTVSADQLALAALMVRLARSDAEYSDEEAERILCLLSAHYGLDEDAARALRQKAQEIEQEATDTVRFTREIKQNVPHEERIKIIEILWAVVLEDGTREASENAMMRLIAGLLGISDVESNIARKKLCLSSPDP